MGIRELLGFGGKPSQQPSPAPQGFEAFTFGEVQRTTDYMHEILGYIYRTWYNGRYYEMPFNPEKIYESQYLSPYHSSAIQLKVQLLCDLFLPSKQLSLIEFNKFATNALIQGNAYLEEIPSKQKGYAVGFISRPAMYVRRFDEDSYGLFHAAKTDLEPINNKVVHFMYHDIEQDFYGKPYYLAALAAANLNQKATHFRSLYYDNGNHAGFILYLNDPAHSLDDVKSLKKALKESKGPGAFRNLFFYAPKGKKDGMQVIPVESAQAQDKFLDIKNVSRDDIIAMHRIPPNMIAVQSTNAGGFGNITEAREALILNEIVPVAKLLAATHPILAFRIPS